MYFHRLTARIVRSKGRLLKILSLAAGLILGFNIWIKLMLVSSGSSLPNTCKYPDVSRVKRGLVYVGVMTARKHLNTRVVAAQETWVRDLPGKVEFFSSEDSLDAAPQDVPVVALPGVTDAYPPMKKSFLMLKYMYDHYVERFDWFVRADDDVYIKGDRLGRFLRSLDPSEPLAIGQPGFGRPEDREAMRFDSKQNYCMGGTGVIFSKETLRKVGPYIQWCLKNLYSIHDDVEFGRCFYNVANVTCSRAYDCRNMFLNNYEGYDEGSIADFDKFSVQRAITLHPNKLPENQYRFQIYILSQRMRGIRHRTLVLSREIRHMTELSERYLLLDDDLDPRKLLSFQTFKEAESSSDNYWECFIGKKFFTVEGKLRTNISEEMKAGLRDVTAQLAEELNPDQWKTSVDIRGVTYGYRRVTSGLGVTYALGVTIRREGRDIRQHMFVQQTFVRAEFSEMDGPTTIAEGGRQRQLLMRA